MHLLHEGSMQDEEFWDLGIRSRWRARAMERREHAWQAGPSSVAASQEPLPNEHVPEHATVPHPCPPRPRTHCVGSPITLIALHEERVDEPRHRVQRGDGHQGAGPIGHVHICSAGVGHRATAWITRPCTRPSPGCGMHSPVRQGFWPDPRVSKGQSPPTRNPHPSAAASLPKDWHATPRKGPRGRERPPMETGGKRAAALHMLTWRGLVLKHGLDQRGRQQVDEGYPRGVCHQQHGVVPARGVGSGGRTVNRSADVPGSASGQREGCTRLPVPAGLHLWTGTRRTCWQTW